MSMFRENYVAVVMQNGKVQPENSDGVCVLPFESEYQVRLKNKSRKRAIADIHIDGRLAVRGVIIEPLGTIDLERFVDGFSLECGPRFKLVKVSDSRVSQPGDSENGVINVNFYPEKDKPKVVEEHKIVHEHCHHCSVHCYHGACRDCCPWCRLYKAFWSGPNIQYTSGNPLPVYGGVFRSMSCSTGPGDAVFASNSGDNLSQMGAKIKSATTIGSSIAEPAATVEGSHSTQQFTHAHVDVDYDHPVSMQIKLKGVLTQQCVCGFKRKNEKFCPECGDKLIAA